MKFRGWESWPPANGCVEQVGVEAKSTGKGPYYVANIGYSYWVDGECYGGVHTESFTYEIEAIQYADTKRGGSLIVHYNPKRVELSRVFEWV